jgi:hypothetical protein
MMTTKTAFNIGDIPSDPLIREQVAKAQEEAAARALLPPVQETNIPEGKSKTEVLQEYIEKFLKGEITEEQLKVIKKTLA